MKDFLSRWFSPLLTHPIGLSLIIFIPYFLHQLHGNHPLTYTLVTLLSVATLLCLSLLHKVPIKLTLIQLIAVGFIIWFNWPQRSEQLGNWNTQLALHMILWISFGFLVSMIEKVIHLKRR